MSVSEALHKAADLIERRGWVTGQGWNEGDGGKPLCLEGGIMAALGLTVDPFDEEAYTTLDEFEACPAYQSVQSYLGIKSQLYQWNDAYIGQRRRTKAEVIEVLRAAALVEETKESAAIMAAADAVDFHEVRA